MDIYIEDYMREALMEMDKFFQEEGNDKEGVYKENYYIRDHLQTPYLSKPLKTPKVQQSIIEFTGKFMDDHSFQLSTSGPIHSFTFGSKEMAFFYDLFQVNEEILLNVWREMINET